MTKADATTNSRPRTIRFTAVVQPRPRGGVAIRLPFDPSAEWGKKDRHDVTGTIAEHAVRGRLTDTGEFFQLELGPAWCRDPRMGPGAEVEVVLGPEGPQLSTMAADLAEALVAAPEARSYFESLATFYRNGFVNWIEAAKRPETRANRIAATIDALRAGKRMR